MCMLLNACSGVQDCLGDTSSGVCPAQEKKEIDLYKQVKAQAWFKTGAEAKK